MHEVCSEGDERGRSRHKNNSKRVSDRKSGERNVGMKKKSAKQYLTSAKDKSAKQYLISANDITL